jgi:hypothetical protein
VAMLLGRRVTFVEPKAQRVSTDDGETISYGQLIRTTGGIARRLTAGVQSGMKLSWFDFWLPKSKHL